MGKITGNILRYLRQADLILLLITLTASGFGLLLIYSATRYTQTNKYVMTQAAAILIGIVGMVILSKMDYHAIASLWKPLAIAGVVILIVTLLLGKGTALRQDSKNWIRFAGLSVQPSEFVKLLFIVTFIKHVDLIKDNINHPINILRLCLHGFIPIVLVMLEGDMGSSLVYFMIFLAMMLAANIKIRYFAAGGVMTLIALPFIWNHIFHATQRYRFLALFNPDAYAQSTGYQQWQGRIAVGSGEFWGYGLYHGPKTQSISESALPVRYSDFIFASASKELGFIGAMLIMIIIAALVLRILYHARTAKDQMGSIICAGIFAMFTTQALANIEMCLYLAPVIGITLPFFSYGGSSIISCYWGVGLVQSISMRRKNAMFT